MENFEKMANEEALARRAKRKPSAKSNEITIKKMYCKGCGLCINICPAGVLLLQDDNVSKFGVSAKVDAPDYCIGCKMCEARCPDFAIFVNYEEGEK